MADMVTPTNEEVLALKFYCDDLDREVTVREWLMEMVKVLWKEQEDFSGKRPFGNSGWSLDPALAMVKKGWISGEYSTYVGWDGKPHEYLEDMDDLTYNRLMNSAVESL